MKELIYHRLLVPSVARHGAEVAFTDHSSGATVSGTVVNVLPKSFE